MRSVVPFDKLFYGEQILSNFMKCQHLGKNLIINSIVYFILVLKSFVTICSFSSLNIAQGMCLCVFLETISDYHKFNLFKRASRCSIQKFSPAVGIIFISFFFLGIRRIVLLAYFAIVNESLYEMFGLRLVIFSLSLSFLDSAIDRVYFMICLNSFIYVIYVY